MTTLGETDRGEQCLLCMHMQTKQQSKWAVKVCDFSNPCSIAEFGLDLRVNAVINEYTMMDFLPHGCGRFVVQMSKRNMRIHSGREGISVPIWSGSLTWFQSAPDDFQGLIEEENVMHTGLSHFSMATKWAKMPCLRWLCRAGHSENWFHLWCTTFVVHQRTNIWPLPC